MTYFDATLEAEPVSEQNTDPILPEDRFVFELIGFERSGPDQYHKNGGIKWTFLVFQEDGRTPFVFQDEQYQLWRTTNVNAAGKPLFTMGTQAHEWAQALLGRTLGPDDHFNISELRGKRMSSMVVWMPKRTKPNEKAATLASLRHVPASQDVAAPAARARVEEEAADAAINAMNQEANDADPDRVFALKKFDRKLAAAKKRKLPSLATFEEAHAAITTSTTAGEIDALVESLDDALDKMDD
jgi:hypothetical protein